jgi:hypothetical protein
VRGRLTAEATALVLEGVLTHPTYRGRSAPRRCQPAPPPCPRIHRTDPRTSERRRHADCSARRLVCRARRLVCRSRRLVCRSRRRAMHTRRAISNFRPSRARGPWAKSPTFAPPPSPDGLALGGGRERGWLRPGTWGRRFGSSSPDPPRDPHDLPGGAWLARWRTARRAMPSSRELGAIPRHAEHQLRHRPSREPPAAPPHRRQRVHARAGRSRKARCPSTAALLCDAPQPLRPPHGATPTTP